MMLTQVSPILIPRPSLATKLAWEWGYDKEKSVGMRIELELAGKAWE